MKYHLIYLVFSLTIIKVNLLLRMEERQELLNKLAKKISLNEEFAECIDDFTDDFKQMKYNVSDIQALQKSMVFQKIIIILTILELILSLKIKEVAVLVGPLQPQVL